MKLLGSASNTLQDKQKLIISQYQFFKVPYQNINITMNNQVYLYKDRLEETYFQRQSQLENLERELLGKISRTSAAEASLKTQVKVVKSEI